MSKEAFAALLESADGFVVYRLRVDPAAPAGAEVEFVSPSLADVMGVSPDTPFDAWFDGIHPDDRTAVDVASRAAANNGEAFDITFRTWHAGRRLWRWIHARSHPVFDDSGMPVAFNGMLLDASAQEEARLRAVELHENVEASQHLETLGKLAGGIAHDVNNLLMIISGNVAALRLGGESMPAPARERHLDGIDQQVAGAAELTALLLGYARQGNYSSAVFDLSTLTAELVAGLGRTRRTVRVTRNTPGAMWVSADPVQVRRAITNLVVNAFDAMPDGGRLEVTLQPSEFEGALHRLTIGDTGPGMDDATLERAFEPFWSTKPRSRGTGLGLSAARGIAEGAGGHLDAESTPGVGTRMHLSLPAVAVPAAAGDAGTAAAPPPGHAADGTGQRPCVRVVDDEPMVAQALQAMVGALGFDALLALDAREALAQCRSHHVDLLLLDVVMPGRSGPELATDLRRATGRRIPFFLCSGYASADVADAARHAGALGFLSKPLRLDTLRDALGGALPTA